MKVRGQHVYSPADRIARKVSEGDNGCWNWTGTLRNGYGRLMVGSRTAGDRRSVSAHRLAYETHIGPIPNGMEVCHRCDNRRCVNPSHLFVGTRQDNIDDREAKGRNNHVVGEDVGGAKLSEVQVLSVRRLRSAGRTQAWIADRFGVHKKTIYDICHGKQWKHLLPPPPASGEG